jgi:SAM-dependent methyltransferase
LEFNETRIEEFLYNVGLPRSFFEGKLCLDAGCGSGRFTFALQQLGAKGVESFDISPEAVIKCRRVNPTAYVFDITTLEPTHRYDFVFCWGVLHHMKNPRKAFAKVASQVNPGGMLHVMLYHKDVVVLPQYANGRELWRNISPVRRLIYCLRKAGNLRDLHGWWDALNPALAVGFTPEEIRQWFMEESFTDIVLTHEKHINMQGIYSPDAKV